MSYQDLQINLTGKDVSASDALRGLARAASVAAREAGASLDGMNRRVEESSQRSSRSVTSGFGSSLTSWVQGGLAGILGGMAASVTSSVTSVVAQAGSAIMGELKSTVIDYNSQLENATIGFTTMLGSGGKATDFLNTLQAFAQRTPFQFGDLTQYAQQMIGYGIKSKDVIKDLSALGDAASGTGRLDTLGNAVLAFEQMAARGKVDLGDLNQLSNAGVPALKILANQYGVSTGAMLKMISTGKVMSADALPKLTAGIEKGTSSTAKFGGMMDKQSGTFTGAMSNIQDSLSQTLSTAFRPFYKMVEGLAVSLSKFATSKDVQKWAADASKWVGGTLNIISGAIKKIFGDPAVQKSIQKLGADLGKAFADVGPTIQKMLPDAITFGKTVLPAIIKAVDGIVKNFPAALDVIVKFGHFLAKNAPAAADFIDGVGKILSGMMKMSAVMDTALIEVESKFNGFRTWIGDFFSGAAGWLTDVGTHIVEGLAGGITGAAGMVQSAIHSLAMSLPPIVRQVLDIHSPSRVFWQIGTHIGEGLTGGLLGSVTQVQSASDRLASTVVSMFEQKKGGISAVTEHAALSTISNMTHRLRVLATERAAALANVANLKSARSSEVSSIRSSNIASGDVSAFAAPGDAIGGLQSLVANTRRFKADLQKLAKMGIDRTTFDQLVNAGVTGGGLTAADALIGNPIDFKEIVSLQKQLGSASGSLANYAGNFDYGKQVALQGGRAKAYGWEMQKVAASGMRTVGRETHININISGHYAGTKDDLAKSLTQVFRDAVRRGVIPKGALANL